MASNDFQGKSDSSLSQTAHQAATVIQANLAAYGVSLPQITSVTLAVNALDADVTEVTAKTAALKAAYEGKRADRANLINVLSVVGAVIYNNPNVTDEMIAAAGFAVHDTGGTPVVPQQPLDLLAAPFADGSVNLKWKRNGNPTGVSFLVESRGATGGWDFVTSTNKARTTVNGFAPGVTTWFRVTATKNDLTSLPSNEAPIYASGGEGALSLAA
ncbi:MAG: fibronectin type III domain-containing protein [Armatimonadetes bacterium]|nr:fibronectin type III domain-containing protein [Armatimonadota bacterium]